MKKIKEFLTILFILTAITTVGGFAACGETNQNDSISKESSSSEVSDNSEDSQNPATYYPVLEVNTLSTQIIKGQSIKIEPVVTYGGEEVNATFTYQSSDSAIVEVLEDGTAKGMKSGVAVVTVTCTYNDILLQDEVTVTVKDAYAFAFIDECVEVQTSGENNQVKVEYYLYINQEIIENAVIEWSVANESVATVNNGIVTGVGYGETILYASYDGIQISIPVYCTVPKYELALDSYSLSEQKPLTIRELNGAVTSIEYEGKDLVESCDVSLAGTAVIPVSVMETLPSGEVKLLIKTAVAHYEAIVYIAQKITVITTAAEFWSIENDMAGYYVLGNDIDFSSTTARFGLGVGESAMSSVNPDACTAFTGVLDGNGYALKNFEVGGSSVQTVFGVNCGTIKNLAVEANWSQTWDGVQAVCMVWANYGTIENTYFQGTFVANSWNDLSYISMVGRNFSEIKNSIAVLDLAGVVANTNNPAGFITYGYPAGTNNTFGVTYAGSSISNCYAYAITINGGGFNGAIRMEANATSIGNSVDASIDVEESEFFANIEENLNQEHDWDMNIWRYEEDALYFGNKLVREYLPIDGNIDCGMYILSNEKAFVIDGLNGEATSVLYNKISILDYCDTSVNGVVTISKEGMATLGTGNVTLIVKTTMDNYEVTLLIVEKITVITTAAEFWSIENDMAGYYVLGNDIDFSSTTARFGLGVGESAMSSVNPDACTAFTGVLDGNGYALKNFEVGGSSVQTVFGVNCGTIKNLAVEANWSQTWDGVQAVCMVWANYGTIENTYFQGTFVANSWNDLSYISMVGRNFSEIKNSIAVLDLAGVVANTNNPAGFITYGYPAGTNNTFGVTYVGSSISNCYAYAITDNSSFGGDVRIAANSGGANGTITETTVYTTASEFGIKLSETISAASGWNMNIWTVQSTAIKFGDEVIYSAN